MIRFLRAALGNFARMLFGVGVDGLNAVGWTLRHGWDALRRGSSQQEAADALDARAAQDRQDALQREEREHRATMEAIATETLEATLAARVAPVPADDDGAVRAERRRRQEAIRAAHEAATDVRSSRFTTRSESEADAATTLRVA